MSLPAAPRTLAGEMQSHVTLITIEAANLRKQAARAARSLASSLSEVASALETEGIVDGSWLSSSNIATLHRMQTQIATLDEQRQHIVTILQWSEK